MYNFIYRDDINSINNLYSFLYQRDKRVFNSNEFKGYLYQMDKMFLETYLIPFIWTNYLFINESFMNYLSKEPLLYLEDNYSKFELLCLHKLDKQIEGIIDINHLDFLKKEHISYYNIKKEDMKFSWKKEDKSEYKKELRNLKIKKILE